MNTSYSPFGIENHVLVCTKSCFLFQADLGAPCFFANQFSGYLSFLDPRMGPILSYYEKYINRYRDSFEN